MHIRVKKSGSLTGTLALPGDKSLSHRALIFAALAEGHSCYANLGPGADVHSTASCLRALGVPIHIDKKNFVSVDGVGLHGLKEPAAPLDCGNSGTTIRLLSGVLAGAQLNCTLQGDEGLSRRPMARILNPLVQMGAQVSGTQQGEKQTPPLTFTPKPQQRLHGFSHVLPIASAQVKSALLLAGLFASEKTSVKEPHLSRDHTERMLKAQGALLEVHDEHGEISITPSEKELHPFTVTRIPGDPSTAAFFAVAASLVAGSNIQLENCSNNKTRVGFLRVLERMGAGVEVKLQGKSLGDEVCNLHITAPKATLRATKICGAEIPTLIDELPILAVLATQAEGTTLISDAKELRVKECDRISVMAKGLQKMGADIDETPDGLIISGPTPLHGAEIDSQGDHRIAMSFTVAGLIAQSPLVVKNAHWACVSHPDFFDELKNLGAHCEELPEKCEPFHSESFHSEHEENQENSNAS